jgi:hypothetical protein
LMEWIKILAPFTISVAPSSFTSSAVTTVMVATLLAEAFPRTRNNCVCHTHFPPWILGEVGLSSSYSWMSPVVWSRLKNEST